MTEASDGTAVDSEGGAGKSLSLTLAKALGRSGCDVDRICDLRRLSGGASQETWAFGAHLRDGGVEQLILRRMPQGERPGDLSAGPELEAQVIALVASAGVPVPAVREVLRPSDGAGRGFVMNLIEGETLARKIIRDMPSTRPARSSPTRPVRFSRAFTRWTPRTWRFGCPTPPKRLRICGGNISARICLGPCSKSRFAGFVHISRMQGNRASSRAIFATAI